MSFKTHYHHSPWRDRWSAHDLGTMDQGGSAASADSNLRACHEVRWELSMSCFVYSRFNKKNNAIFVKDANGHLVTATPCIVIKVCNQMTIRQKISMMILPIFLPCPPAPHCRDTTIDEARRHLVISDLFIWIVPATFLLKWLDRTCLGKCS